MSLSDYIVAFVRTVVPAAAGALIAWLAARLPFVADLLADVPEPQMLGFYGFLTVAAVAGYYALVRWLGRRWPSVEKLLGWKATPTYSPPSS